jgi:hypothetical protein
MTHAEIQVCSEMVRDMGFVPQASPLFDRQHRLYILNKRGDVCVSFDHADDAKAVLDLLAIPQSGNRSSPSGGTWSEW